MPLEFACGQEVKMKLILRQNIIFNDFKEMCACACEYVVEEQKSSLTLSRATLNIKTDRK